MPALKPLPSVARLEANRANAQKSTGPRTDAGKARSRGNALKHGMAGAGIALPTEDRERVEGRFAALQAELGPTTALGAHFVGKIALMTVRAERAARHESAALAHRVRHAADEFDRARREAAESLRDRLGDAPAAAHRELLRTPEGVDALADSLLDLRAVLNRREPEWSVEHEDHYEACHGRRIGDRVVTRGLALSRALLGDFGLLGPADRDPAAAGRPPIRTWVAALIGEIDAELDRLAAHRASLDHDAIAEDRAEAAGPAEPAAPDPAPAPAPIEDPATFAAKSRPVNGLNPPSGSFGDRPPVASVRPAAWAGPAEVGPGPRPPAPDLALPGSAGGL